jgi:polysaccharide pyruvyl transferase WcaK-like protein/coenzyme F420-reducing hydrogenase beta subunit
MNDVLLTNLYNCSNMGEVLQLRALVAAFPEDKFTLASWYSFVDKGLCDELGVRVVGPVRPPGKVSLLINAARSIATFLSWTQLGKPALSRLLRAYVDCDYVVDLGGDTFSDNPSPTYTLAHCFALLPAMLARKPYVVCSQSIGPFRTPFTRLLAQHILKRATRITARDPISYRYLVGELGLDASHVDSCRDLAYLLEPEYAARPGVIGLNPSALAHRHMDRSPAEYADFLATLVRTLSARHKVILIPHVYGPRHGLGSVANQDDRQVIDAVARLVSVETGTHEDIRRCSLFIGFRMHACISAISRGIPTVALSYSQKSSGLPRFDWVKTIDIRGMAPDDLMKAIAGAASALASRARGAETERTQLRCDAHPSISAIDTLKATTGRDLLGNHLWCAVGKSRDKKILAHAASAGVVSSLVRTALEDVAEAVVADTSSGVASPVSIVNAEDAARCAGSAYANDEHALACMVELCSGERKVVVGLPCQVSALRALYPHHLYVGLFCSHRVRPEGISFLLRHFGLIGRQVRCRAKALGTTGMLVDQSFFIPLSHYWNRFLNYSFIPSGCVRCRDLTAERADISVGDAWRLPGTSTRGLNAIVCRTEKGVALLDRAVREGTIELTEVSPTTVVCTQRDYLMLKKGILTGRLRVYKLLRTCGNFVSNRRTLHPVLHVWLRLAVKGQALPAIEAEPRRMMATSSRSTLRS